MFGVCFLQKYNNNCSKGKIGYKFSENINLMGFIPDIVFVYGSDMSVMRFFDYILLFGQNDVYLQPNS